VRRRTPGQVDDVDRSIIGVLAGSPRASYADVARTVGLSEAAVRTRVLRMLEDGTVIITGRVDPAVLGVGTIAIAFIGSTSPLHDVAERIGAFPEVVFVVTTMGAHDMIVEARCRDANHLLHTLDRLRDVDGVDTIEPCTALRYYKQDWSSVGLPANAMAPRMLDEIGGNREVAPLDDVDRKLIAALVEDGRATFGRLARIVGLSQAAVRVRVLKLLDRGVVSVQLLTNKDAMGVGGFGGVGLIVDGAVHATAEQVAAIPETTLVAATSGRYDVVTELWWFDESHLLDVLDRIRTLPGVRSIQGLVYLVEEKSDYTGYFLRD